MMEKSHIVKYFESEKRQTRFAGIMSEENLICAKFVKI